MNCFHPSRYIFLNNAGFANLYPTMNSIEANTESDDFKEFQRIKQKFLAKDKSGKLVFLADSAFSLQMTQDKYRDIQFHYTSEF